MGQNRRWDSMASGSLGSTEEWGYLNAAECPSIRAGKLAENSNLGAGFLLGVAINWELLCSRVTTLWGPAKGRTLVRAPLPPSRKNITNLCWRSL